MKEWYQVVAGYSMKFKCHYCDKYVAENGFFCDENDTRIQSLKLVICPNCGKPTFFDHYDNQIPAEKYGNDIEFLPDNVHELYEEARLCFSVNAFTSSALACRKLLMNIAVDKGAKEGLYFVNYVDYLNENNFIPPNGKDWVDEIRNLGNEATHEISLKTKDDAEEAINFTEMLLKFIYEYPMRLERKKQKSTQKKHTSKKKDNKPKTRVR